MHLILTGATGLVGSGVLDAMLAMKEVTKISILSRRPVQMAEDAHDPRVQVILHQGFEAYDPKVLSQLQGATGCVWALGISQTKVNKEDYIKITKTYAVEAAKAFRTLPPPNQPFHFVYVSGTGATTQPGFFTSLFARVKGETELELAELRRATPLFRASSVRPAFIDHAHHEAIKKYVPPRPTYETLFRPLAPVFRAAMPGLCSPTEQLGRFLTEMAMGRHEDRSLYIPNFPPLTAQFNHLILLLDQQRSLASATRIIDRTFGPGEDRQIMNERTKQSTGDISSSGPPDPPDMFLAEDLASPSGHEGNQSRTKVTRAVKASTCM
ncbi:hypothetical protein KXW18_004943, partial [Aspergillus fumigatus]